MREYGILKAVEIFHFKEVLCLLKPVLSHDNGSVLFIHNEVTSGLFRLTGLGLQFFTALHLLGYRIRFGIVALVTMRRTRDDKRCSRLIDKNGVNFIHDRKVVLTLHFLFNPNFHVVTQVVKTVFIVGTIGDVSSVLGFSASLIMYIGNDTSYCIS